MRDIDGLADYAVSQSKNGKSISFEGVSQLNNDYIAKQAHGFVGVNTAIKEYNRLKGESTEKANKFAETIGKSNANLGKYLSGLKNTTGGMSGYAISLVGATVKTVALQVATTALNAALSMGISLLIQGVVQLGAWLWSFVPTAGNLAKKFEEATEELKEINSEIESLNSELENVQGRINELNSKGTLSITEEAELQRLMLQNAELERQIELQKILQLEASKKQQKKFVNKYKNLDAEQTDEIVGFASDEYIEEHGKEEASKKISEYSDMVKTNQEDIQALYDAGYVYGTNKEVDARIDAMNRATDAYMYAMNKVGDTEVNWFGGIIARFPNAKTALDELAKSGEITAEKLKTALNGEYGEELKNLLTYLSSIGAIDLKGILGDDRFGELDINLDGYIDTTEAAKMGTEDFIKLMPSIVAEFNKTGDAADAAGGNVNKMTVSLSELEDASDKIKTVGDAFKEFSDNGYLSIKTLGELQTATGLSDAEFEKYKNTLLSAKTGSVEFNQIMSEMTFKILDNTFKTKDLTDVTEEEIAAILRENNITNAGAIAKQYKAKATIKAILAEADYSKGIGEVVSSLETECGVLGLTQTEIYALAGVYHSAQSAMNKDVVEGAAKRLGILEDELTAIEGLADAYAAIGDYSLLDDGQLPLSPGVGGVYDSEDYKQYREDVEKILAYGRAKDKIKEALDSIGDTDISFDPDSSGGSGSDKNEALDNYLKDAENRYKIHQDETKYIEELNHALQNLVKTEDERLDVTGKINEAYRDLAENRIKDLEHQIDLKKELYGEDYDATSEWSEIQRIASEEADRYREYARTQLGYYNEGTTEEQKAEINAMIEKTDEIQDNQKTWWDAENNKLDFYSKQYENKIRDIEHAREMLLASNPYADTTLFDKQLQDLKHERAEILRALDPEKYKEEIQELELGWWDDQHNKTDWSLSNSQNWIDERNFYGDWKKYGDSEVKAWKRVLDRFRKEYPNELEKIREIEHNYFEALKTEITDTLEFAKSKISSLATLQQAYYDVTNSIAEAQHEIDKELRASLTMYEHLDEESRKLLFNQEDYNALTAELNKLQNEANRLQSRYQNAIENSTEETLEEITSQYEMQYDLMMKKYEIAKAELEVAKKRQQLDNVLNERNVRMFINGQWQWVANTQDVINAQNELADAKYEAQQAKNSKKQTESMNELTKAQDLLTTAINSVESGVIDFENHVGGVTSGLKEIITKDIPALKNIISGVGSAISSYQSGIKGASDSGGNSNSDANGEKKNKYSWYYSNHKSINGFASGTNNAKPGLAWVGEEEPELFIDNYGHLVPINEPALFNMRGGESVFNQAQLANVKALYDMVNIPKVDYSYMSALSANRGQSVDSSTHYTYSFGGITLNDSDGKQIVNILKRYIPTHRFE